MGMDLDGWILENIQNDDLRSARNRLLGDVCRPFNYMHAEVVAELGLNHLLV